MCESSAAVRQMSPPRPRCCSPLREGEQCTEWIVLTRLLVELEARGCDGPTRLVPLFLGPDRRLSWWANTLRGDVRGVEYRGDIFTLDLKRRPAG